MHLLTLAEFQQNSLARPTSLEWHQSGALKQPIEWSAQRYRCPPLQGDALAFLHKRVFEACMLDCV